MNAEERARSPCHFSADETSLNTFCNDPETAVSEMILATPMSEASSAYSIAVAPVSSLRSLRIVIVMFAPFGNGEITMPTMHAMRFVSVNAWRQFRQSASPQKARDAEALFWP